MKIRILIGVFALALFALNAQAPPPLPLVSAWYSLDNAKTNSYKWMAVDPPLTVTVDATGRPHLGFYFRPMEWGTGLIQVDRPGQPSRVDVDLSLISYRIAPPASSGPCSLQGSGAWAADSGFFYLCASGVWARAQLETNW